jgi:biofilm PGA synthesis N-glycosyltransferase PgaC
MPAVVLAMAVFWASVALILYTYAGYPLILWLLTRGRRPPELPEPETTALPFLSVLIAAHNEEAVITAKLENCIALDYPADRIEFLFGSDGSDDRTEELIRAGAASNVRLFCFARRGKAAVINDLILQSRGEIVVFTDANTLFEPAAARWLARRFQDPCVGGVCGRLVIGRINASSSRLLADEANYWQFENVIKRLEGQLGLLAAANGAIYAIRRSLFRPLPTLRAIADDLLIPAAVLEHQAHMVYEPAAVAHESGAVTTRVELLRKIRIGEISYNTLPVLSRLLPPWHGRVAWMLWSHKIIRWAVPFLLLALLAASVALWFIPFYRVCLLLQVLTYAGALAGYWLDGRRNLPAWLSLPYYFVGSNLALLVGFGRSLVRSTSGAWARVGR